MFTDTALKIGDSLPEFSLKGIDDKYYTSKDYKTSKALIIIFTCNHCPYAQAYENRLIKLQEFFKNKNVNFIAINSNDERTYPEDSFENMIKRADQKKYNYPYLRDESQEIAKKFGASFTPEVFVFDSNMKMQYHGRIDDNWQEEDKVTKENLKDAINSILEGKEINRANTQAIGCTVKWKN